jgi:hypothetical protein
MKRPPYPCTIQKWLLDNKVKIVLLLIEGLMIFL